MANRVVVLLSDEELAAVKARAGIVPLSAWFRALALTVDSVPSDLVNGETVSFRPEGETGDARGLIAKAIQRDQEIMRRDFNRPPEMSPAEWRRGPRQKGDKSR